MSWDLFKHILGMKSLWYFVNIRCYISETKLKVDTFSFFKININILESLYFYFVIIFQIHQIKPEETTINYAFSFKYYFKAYYNE